MKIGVIGLGAIGERHVRTLQASFPNVSINILTSRTRWKDKGMHTMLIQNENKFFSVKHDVYFITNETGKHAKTIVRCIAQNPKGIFVEKPLCLTLKEVDAIRKALKNYHGVFFVAYCFQFFKPIAYLKKLVQNNAVGKIIAMRVSVGQDLRTWGKLVFFKGFRSKRIGGGVILDLVHDINYPAWILGKELSYLTGAYGRLNLPIEAEDMSEALFRASGGTLVSVHQDYVQRPGSRSCEILGEKGTIRWHRSLRKGTTQDEIRIDRMKNTKIIRLKTNPADMYKDEVLFFIRRARRGQVLNNFQEAARDMKNILSLKSCGVRLQ